MKLSPTKLTMPKNHSRGSKSFNNPALAPPYATMGDDQMGAQHILADIFSTSLTIQDATLYFRADQTNAQSSEGLYIVLGDCASILQRGKEILEAVCQVQM